jgi:hypothetical protein
MKHLLKLMFGAACLDPRAYDQVDSDEASWRGAVLTALIASVAASIGAGTRTLIEITNGTIVLLITWLAWVGLTYVIGTRLFRESATQSSIGEVLRTTGFSASPGILRVLAVIPSIAFPVSIVITLWMLLAFVIAIRESLKYTSLLRAFGVCLLGWLIYGVVFFGFVYVAL